MKHILAVAAVLVTLIPIVNAAPRIIENTISWPDDGWYQVQEVTDSDIVAICEGGESCKVWPGEFIVINHTTGERFEDIFIEPPTVTVDGNVINYPDDGWYQVQDSTTYQSICSGDLSCTVEPGTYKVINHTSGAIYRNIVVVGNSANPPDDKVLAPEPAAKPDVITDALDLIPLDTIDAFYDLSEFLYNNVGNISYTDNLLGAYEVDGQVLGDLYACPDGGTIALVNAQFGEAKYVADNCANSSVEFTGDMKKTFVFRRIGSYLGTELGSGSIVNKNSGESITIENKDGDSGITIRDQDGLYGPLWDYLVNDVRITIDQSEPTSIDMLMFRTTAPYQRSSFTVDLTMRGVSTPDIDYSSVTVSGEYALDADGMTNINFMSVDIEWPEGVARLSSDAPSDVGDFVLSDGTTGSINWSDISLVNFFYGI